MSHYGVNVVSETLIKEYKQSIVWLFDAFFKQQIDISFESLPQSNKPYNQAADSV